MHHASRLVFLFFLCSLYMEVRKKSSKLTNILYHFRRLNTAHSFPTWKWSKKYFTERQFYISLALSTLSWQPKTDSSDSSIYFQKKSFRLSCLTLFSFLAVQHWQQKWTIRGLSTLWPGCFKTTTIIIHIISTLPSSGFTILWCFFWNDKPKNI